MKTSFKNFKGRLSQTGSMMIEAIAMLALISLVTPTLYRKSAERTTELQDINTATHARTVLKAIDNYVKTNYQELISTDGHFLPSDGSIYTFDITEDEYKPYFPYGYDFNDMKNFQKPKVALRRQGDSVTSFVEFPSLFDLGELRAARIASIIGSNGGYISGNGNAREAKGVGGIWGLTSSELNELEFDGAATSIVAASSDAINSATSGALENEKYLQRTPVESPDQLWRNTMTTDLYMGTPNTSDELGSRYKILGVDQLILGSIDHNANTESLVVTEAASGGGSAWIASTLHALADTFRLDKQGDDYSMVFGTEDSTIVNALTDYGINFNNDQILFQQMTDEQTQAGEVGATFKVNTEVDEDLTVYGNTYVAIKDGKSFRAGVDGSYITADADHVDLLGGNIVTSRTGGDPELRNTTVDTDVLITGKTKMGTGDAQPTRPNWDMRLNVQGNAFVSDILEAGEIDTKKFKALSLHAGGTDYDQETWWLNATPNGVTITNPENGDHRLIANEGNTYIYGPGGDESSNGALMISTNEAHLRGEDTLELYTTATEGRVALQGGSMILNGRYGLNDGNENIQIFAPLTTVNNGVFKVQSGTNIDPESVVATSLYVDPSDSGLVQVNAQNTRVAPRGNGSFEVVENNADENGLSIFRVTPSGLPSDAGSSHAFGEMDTETFRLSDVHNNAWHNILEVDLDGNANGSDNQNREGHNTSVYIRRGAIEIEPSNTTNNTADTGRGYVEASRFVANNPTYRGRNVAPNPSDAPIQPKYVSSYQDNMYYNNSSNRVEYDRYMVNPAYTSVMHDIKLTTRGGARLSDILPDFINKGIYVVNNTYREDPNLDFNRLSIPSMGAIRGSRVDINGNFKEVGDGSGTEYASPFLGMVPAPQCPPGYARVITITPAGFQMAQAGQMTSISINGSQRFIVNDLSSLQRLGDSNVDLHGSNATLAGATYRSATITDSSGNQQKLYYLGYASEPEYTTGGSPYMPQPLYFQQSTWLRSLVFPYAAGGSSPCNDTRGSDSGCGENFVGWATVMGFIYPASIYQAIIEKITGETLSSSADLEKAFWNVFPVRGRSLEAYATVYCYFDRSGILHDASGIPSDMIDRYDQLNNFRDGYKKDTTSNTTFTDRLDDPALHYYNPW